MAPRLLPRRRWLRWLLLSGVVVVALVVGGPFVYIHLIEGSPPDRLDLTSQSEPADAPVDASDPAVAAGPGATDARTGPIEGTWRIADGSEAGYRVKETLFGQSTTAVGRTSAITGSITIKGSDVVAARMSVDMTKVSSDQSVRDGQFRGRIMETDRYPTATFVLDRPIKLGSVPAMGKIVAKQAAGKLTLHGTTKPVTFEVKARHDASSISVSGSIPVTFADYEISNPSGGPATTADNGLLEFLLTFTRS